MKRASLYIIILLAAINMACGRHQAKEEQRMLTVSIEPQRYLLERIAGPEWEVNTLLAGGADPENYDPPMAALKNVADSRAYFKTGHIAFENELLRRIGSGTTIVDTSAGIDLIEGTHIHHDGHDGHHTHSDIDPHVWTSAKNARIIARNMLNAMIEIDPAGAEGYTERYNRLSATIDSLDRAISTMLAHHAGSAFIVWHPSLSYFARDYSLEQLSLVFDNKEMSAEQLRQRIDMARQHNASVFFLQPEFDNRQSRQLAEATGTKAIPISPLGYDWADDLMNIARAISSTNNSGHGK